MSAIAQLLSDEFETYLVHDQQLLPQPFVLEFEFEERVEHGSVLRRVRPRHRKEAFRILLGLCWGRRRGGGGVVPMTSDLEEDVTSRLRLESIVEGKGFLSFARFGEVSSYSF